MKVVIEESALEDLKAIVRFYEKQESGVGSYFVAQFSTTAGALRSSGGSHSRRHGYYRCSVEKFPVSLYYKIEEEEVRIRAVLDDRRSPRLIRNQLKRL